MTTAGRTFFKSALCLLVLAGRLGAEPGSSPARALEFTEKFRLSISEPARKIRVWVPLPANDPYQKSKVLKIQSPLAYRKTRDPEFGNPMLYFESDQPSKDPIEIRISYEVLRKEQAGLSGEGSGGPGKEFFPVAGYLKPRGLEIISDEIRKIAAETTRGLEDPVEKARAIYLYVLKHVQYDKSGTGWGRGDSVFACEVGKGNCTDFHSLFIVMARASLIPARFRMGIPLPQEAEGKPSGGYHCWAEFRVEGRGWIPVDISEAWKDPGRADYLFGNLDPDRVLLSTGRDIALSPRQSGPPLNYFSKPYVEIDGKPFENFELERTYRNIN